MQTDDSTRLRHMLESAYDARDFAQNRTRADLDTDRMLVRALINCIEVMGEAAYKLTKDLREHHPEIPWKQIINMRNRLIHGYFTIQYLRQLPDSAGIERKQEREKLNTVRLRRHHI